MIELGKIIQEKRITDSLTVEDITDKLNIRQEYVTAIEDGNINSFASEAYYYGYLKQYLKLLQIEDIALNDVRETAPDLTIKEPTRKAFKLNFAFMLIIFIVSIILYNICADLIFSDNIDPIALELNNHISSFVQISDDNS